MLIRRLALSLLLLMTACATRTSVVSQSEVAIVAVGPNGLILMDGAPVDDATIKARSANQGRVFINPGPGTTYKDFMTAMARLEALKLPIALIGEEFR